MDSLFSKSFAVLRAGRFRATVLLLAVSSLALGCEPPRMLVTDTGVSLPDAESMDTGAPPDSGVRMDSGVPVDTGARRDATTDTADGAGDCDFLRCDEMCVAAGAIVGRCRMNNCVCDFPGGDGGVRVDGAASDARTGVDVVLESSIRGCMSNAECPPSMFCSSTSCMGPGSCALRQELDPNRCMPDTSPSCGCDGLLYPSACARTAIGVRQDPMRRCDGDAAVIPMSDASSGGG